MLACCTSACVFALRHSNSAIEEGWVYYHVWGEICMQHPLSIYKTCTFVNYYNVGVC